MRIGTLAGRAVLICADGTRSVDLAKASDGRFGPEPSSIFERWADLVDWYDGAALRLAADADPFEVAELGPPSPQPRQVFAIGLNYRDHAAESGHAAPEVPPTFTKFIGSFAGPVTELMLPADTVDWEAELVVVIGRRADRVSADQAWQHVAGLTVGQDYSERALQLAGPAPQFSLGKSYPGFAPQGPWLVTPDELPGRDALALSCTVNGRVVQQSSTDQLIFTVPQLIEHLSAVTPLLPGDVIFTGTPAGVGGTRQPPWFLRDGDLVETTIEGIGTLRQTCRRTRQPLTHNDSDSGSDLS